MWKSNILRLLLFEIIDKNTWDHCMGMLLNMTCFIVWQIGKGTMGNGTLGNVTFQNVSRETVHFYYLGNGTFYSLGKGTLYSLGTILSPGNQTTYPLGIGPLILWESGHLSSGIRDILWETGHWKRDTLASGNRTTYPLGNILWESGIWGMDFNRLVNYY